MARTFFDEIPRRRLSPDVITYYVFITGLCNKGLYDEAYNLFLQMERNGCVPNVLTKSLLFHACFRGMGTEKIDNLSW